MRIFALTFACLFGLASAGMADPSRLTAERALAFLGLDAADTNTLRTTWNQIPIVFVDYDAPPDPEMGTVRNLRAVTENAQHQLVAHDITTALPDAGMPMVAALGFANADRDPADELIVLIRIDQRHYDYGGYFVEVQIIDDLKPGMIQAKPLPQLSAHFGMGCVCSFRDGRQETYRFDSIAAIKRELKRMGY